MAVVAMLVCESAESEVQGSEQGKVYLRGVTNETEEAKMYFAYTPFASLEMGILNPAAFAQFEPGKIYRMTLEQID
jgi:hypothetical protein